VASIALTTSPPPSQYVCLSASNKLALRNGAIAGPNMQQFSDPNSRNAYKKLSVIVVVNVD